MGLGLRAAPNSAERLGGGFQDAGLAFGFDVYVNGLVVPRLSPRNSTACIGFEVRILRVVGPGIILGKLFKPFKLCHLDLVPQSSHTEPFNL